MTFAQTPPLRVFLDTQVFRKLGFDWTAAELSSLKKRAKARSIEVLITDIVTEECAQQIKTLHNEALQAFEKSQAKSVSLRSGNPEFAAALDTAKATLPTVQKLIVDMERYLVEIEAVRLPYPFCVEDLFKLYFGGSAPFGTKGKKSEFPDAANLLSILQYAEEQNEQIIVVSGDDDWRRVAEQRSSIIHVDLLSDVLSHAIRLEWTDGDLRSDEQILTAICGKSDVLTPLLQSSLYLNSKVNLGDGYLEELKVRNIDPTHFTTTDAYVEGAKIICFGELTYIVDFFAEMKLGDPQLNNEIEQSVSGQDTMTANLEVSFDPTRLDDIEILSVDHFEGIDLWIDLEA